jgi:hypothetical protein
VYVGDAERINTVGLCTGGRVVGVAAASALKAYVPAGYLRMLHPDCGLYDAALITTTPLTPNHSLEQDDWQNAIALKEKACRAFARHGSSYVFQYKHETH